MALFPLKSTPSPGPIKILSVISIILVSIFVSLISITIASGHRECNAAWLVGCVATVIKPLPLNTHARAANMIAPPKLADPPINRILP